MYFDYCTIYSLQEILCCTKIRTFAIVVCCTPSILKLAPAWYVKEEDGKEDGRVVVLDADTNHSFTE